MKKDYPQKKKKFQPSHRDILTKKERHRLLLACEKYEEVMFTRIGLNSGLRIQEIVDLESRDFVFEENQIRIRNGKGGKARWACCDTPTLQMICAFINENKLKPTDRIFTKSNRAYQYMIDRLAAKAKINRVKVTPHTLRHTNITMLLENKMPIEQVQQHAGHEDISTTMIYTHLTYAPIKKTFLEIMGE